jgi:hypothetical protein
MQRRLVLAAGALLVVACGSSGSSVSEHGGIGSSSSALTGDQCSYFAQNGKTNVCHYTGAAKKPYNLISADIATCDDHAANHPNDFVSVTGDCSNPGCLPDGAPVDITHAPANPVTGVSFKPPCCSGRDPAFGVCQPTGDRCTFDLPGGAKTGFDCPPVNNPACFARSCNGGTGVCETSVITGRGCGDECATDADCIVTINGGAETCQISTCVQSGSVYVCAYAPRSCDDGNGCTQDWCEVGVGCQHAPISGCTP